MSTTAVKDKGVTVITMATDSHSLSPPLCQILKTLCCSPLCCSLNKGLMQSDVTAALGTIQIMVGLFNIGLGPGRTRRYPGDFTSMEAAYWLGGVFIATGIVNLLAKRFPSLCSVSYAVCANMVGSGFAIVGTVLYANDATVVPAFRMCDWKSHIHVFHYVNCGLAAYYVQLRAMDITLIIMAVLQLFVCISVAALGIKAVVNRKKEECQQRNTGEDEEPQLNEVLLISPADKNHFN